MKTMDSEQPNGVSKQSNKQWFLATKKMIDQPMGTAS